MVFDDAKQDFNVHIMKLINKTKVSLNLHAPYGLSRAAQKRPVETLFITLISLVTLTNIKINDIIYRTLHPEKIIVIVLEQQGLQFTTSIPIFMTDY